MLLDPLPAYHVQELLSPPHEAQGLESLGAVLVERKACRHQDGGEQTVCRVASDHPVRNSFTFSRVTSWKGMMVSFL